MNDRKLAKCGGVCLALVMLMGWGCSAQAQSSQTSTNSGNDLLSVCTDNGDLQWLCHGFISGVSATNRLHSEISSDRTLYCMPGAVTNGQMEAVVLAYLKAHPEKRHYSAASLTTSAFMEAFPCPRPVANPR